MDTDRHTTSTLTVRVKAPADPLVSRTFTILQDRIQRRCPTRVVAGGPDAQLVLTLVGDLPPEAFRINQVRATVRIAGGSPLGLLYGVGKFLRTSRYEGAFAPSPSQRATL